MQLVDQQARWPDQSARDSAEAIRAGALRPPDRLRQRRERHPVHLYDCRDGGSGRCPSTQRLLPTDVHRTAIRDAQLHAGQLRRSRVRAYLYTLGRKSVELEEFAEEVRDVNTYTAVYAWHPEGKIVGKIIIPARRIEKIELYRLGGVEEELERDALPAPACVFKNAAVYRDPLQYANVRGFPEIP